MGGLGFILCPLMLLDAMVPYPGADLFVRIDVPEEIRHQRIRERDIRWGSNVAERIGHLDATWRSVEAETVELDLVIDGTKALTGNAAFLAAFLRQWLG